MTADPLALPFQEAIEHYSQKVSMPTARWGDLLEGQHTRAFTVAGATKDALLADFRTAIDTAIAQGTTLDTFRKDFDTIVAKHGWSYNGTRGWRSRVIYDTNLSTAYAAGRWQQMTDPDVLRYQFAFAQRNMNRRNGADDLDAQLDAQLTCADADARRALVHDIQRRIVESGRWLPICDVRTVTSYRPELTGIELDTEALTRIL